MIKRLPEDYSKQELHTLVLHHHEKHSSTKTKLEETRQKLIAAQKELSRLKRNA